MTRSDSYCRGALPHLGGRPRQDLRWQTNFGQWVGEVGVPAIVSELETDPDLRVSAKAVYSWLRGCEPRPDRARALVNLSGGAITLNMIYCHRRDLERLRRAAEAEGAGDECRSQST